MSKWKTQFDKHERVFCESGSQVVEEYIGHYDSNGELVLEKTGEKNIYNEIQSHEPSCNINSILARYRAGEESVLNQPGYRFGDFSLIPNSLLDAVNRLEDAKAVFKSLPLEEREKYGQSFEKWISSFGEYGAVFEKPENVSPDFQDASGVAGSVPENVEGVNVNE